MKSSFLNTALVAVSLCLFCGPVARSATPPYPSPSASHDEQPASSSTVVIPGPLRSFLRMAAISQKSAPEEVLPLLARNIFMQGYVGPRRGRQTEFLVLLIRYVHQARELSVLAGPQGVLHASNCEDAKPLLKVLGYRPRPECGRSNAFLLTDDPQRAFLTVDSGFPLQALEECLRKGKPFDYPFPASPLASLLPETAWRQKSVTSESDFLDALLQNPFLAHFYWALSRIDRETQAALRQPQSVPQIIPLAAELDFYGTHLRVRSGRVIVPGGPSAEPAWKDLVGASPQSPAEFIVHLFARDRGWLAAYFDVLSRVSSDQQAHFVERTHLRRYYEALRGNRTSPDAVTGVYRPNPGLLLLVARSWFEPSGAPHVPGNLESWRKILTQKKIPKIKHLSIASPDQLLETMFSLSRVPASDEPVQAYLYLSELDALRGPDHRVSPETTVLLAAKFADFGDQFLLFSEFPDLDDASIAAFLTAAEAVGKISNASLRGNALGTFQASIGLWQILARQGQIPPPKMNVSWQQLIQPFAKVASSTQVFDAGRNSVRQLLLAASGDSQGPQDSEDKLISLLAGPPQLTPDARQMHALVANRIRAILEEQRLVSLDVLLPLGDALHDVARVKAEAATLLPLAAELREFEMPQPIFRPSEHERWAAGIYNNRHTDVQMRTDLTPVIKAPASPSQLAAARGQMASFLRDTLVGLNYAYYEPPGAQLLHHNPLFVRSHDFAGETVVGMDRLWQAPTLFGAGSPAGGGAHLIGSLADLPYVLSRAEQDFIAPENVQALIWGEVVPALLTSAILPRWWRVTPNELHAAALYQKTGEELLAAAAHDEDLRHKVMLILDDRLAPRTSEALELALQAGRFADAPPLLPADTFWLTAEFRRRFPGQTASFGPSGLELETLARRFPEEVDVQRLARDFGVPHIILQHSNRCDLLNIAPPPAFAGYSSRLLAESWESNNLYWARLADEKGYSPVMLTRLVPELTRRMVEKIFATELEDWPALARAMRETGDDFRNGKMASLLPAGAPSQPLPQP